MPSDSDARRDKALETIAREMVKQTKLLDRIERNTRPAKLTFHNTPEPDVSVQQGADLGSEQGPYGYGPQPYE